jgi:hypothetical protein
MQTWIPFQSRRIITQESRNKSRKYFKNLKYTSVLIQV